MKAPSPTADFERLAKLAAKLGIILAIVCHLAPPHYRIACDALAALCRGDVP